MLKEEQAKIEKIVLNFYNGLFSSEGNVNFEEVLLKVKSVVPDDLNQTLLLPFHREEFRTALFQMKPLKALGLDGLHALVFQQCWDIIGDEVSIF